MRYLTKKDLSILLGNALDNFDTSIYAFLAPLLGPLFFPKYDPIVQLILTYSVMGVSFFARPIGAFIFGVIARKRGPIFGLSYSLIGVAIATVYTGFLPTYESIGWLAPLSLVLTRIVKGIFAAGESTIAKLHLMEEKSDGNALKVSHLYQSSSMLGTIFASGAATLIIAFQPEAWRLCFWLGGITGGMGYFLRRYASNHLVSSRNLENLSASLDFLDIREPENLVSTIPRSRVLRKTRAHLYSLCFSKSRDDARILFSNIKPNTLSKAQLKEQARYESYQFSHLWSLWENRVNILRVAMGTGFGHLTYSIPFVFMNSFIPLITSISLETMMVFNTSLLVLDMVMIPFIGRLLLRFKAEKVMITASLVLSLTVMPLFALLPQASLSYVLFVRIWIVFWGIVFLCPLNFWFNSLFNTSERYLLVGMGTALGASSIGRITTPLCLWLWYVSGLSVAPSLYIVLLTLITAFAVQTLGAPHEHKLTPPLRSS